MPSGDEGGSPWTEVRLEIPAEFEDLAVGILSEEAPGGCLVETCADGRTRLVVHVRHSPDIVEVLRQQLGAVGCPDIDFAVEEVPDEDWMASWMRTFVPIRVTDRIWVRPPWHECDAPADAVVLSLNPSMAFGTGHHETTRIVLGFIEDRIRPGDRCLDVGCGTGILSIAALLLGANRMTMVEIDPDAREVARREVQRNGVADRVEWASRAEDVSGVDGAVMNITADVVCDLLPSVAQSVSAGGWIAVSGILVGQVEAVRSRAEGLGLEVRDECRDGEWWGAVLEKA